MENLVSVYQTSQHSSWILHTDSPWVCVIEVCSDGGATYIIGQIIAKII